MKQNKLLIVGMLVLPILLSACGGASGSSTNSANTVNGITVPPVPDPTLNAATLAGVDSNSNGVRDDVERSIAAKTTDVNAYNNTVLLAAQINSLVTQSGMTKAQVNSILHTQNCLALKTSIDIGDIGSQIINTKDRKNAYQTNAANGDGAFFSTADNDCKK
jgi:small basic protein